MLHSEMVRVCMCVRIKTTTGYLTAHLHLLDDALLGLQHEVTVVRPRVGEVHMERGEHPEGLWVFSLQQLGHVEAVHHLALPSLLSLVDAVQKLHLQHTHAAQMPVLQLLQHESRMPAVETNL